ncbi:MAG: hypothetical protein PHV74_10305 [Dehalococcoidia bacterium]|nr:hypothetical protein [Dehalococcoidia bacterium]
MSGSEMNPTLDDIRSQVENTVAHERSQYAPKDRDNGHHVVNPDRAPELPKEAWQGLFGDYRDLVGPTTEAPDEFHYAVFCQVLG